MRVETVLLRRREEKVEVAAVREEKVKVAAVREEKFGVARSKTGWARGEQEHWAE